MKLDNLEKQLRAAKFSHLTEDELDYYRDQKLDTVSQARADAHLKLCLICERRLQLLNEESAASYNQDISTEDIALVKRVMQRKGQQQQSSDSQPIEATNRVRLKNRLADGLQQIVESWQAHFLRQEPVRGIRDSNKAIWQGQSKDGSMKAYATRKKNASLTIHFSSNDLSLEGQRFNVSLGSMNRDITLQLVSESEVYAEVEITRYQLPINLADLQIKEIS
jgi:hypothetical protein